MKLIADHSRKSIELRNEIVHTIYNYVIFPLMFKTTQTHLNVICDHLSEIIHEKLLNSNYG